MKTALTHPRRLLPLLLLAAAPLAGCQWFNKAPRLAGAGMDMFTPTKMRLHPLTRIVMGSPDATVEARIELTDQFNNTSKGAGAVYFELFAYQPLIPNHRGDRLGLWNFDLNKPQENKDHWDNITRTYLCKLPVPAGPLQKNKRVLLAATFTLPNGARLTDDLLIDLK